jgi:hypothetical protein
VAIFGFRKNGVVISEATVPAAGLISRARIYAELDGASRTGVAVANPSTEPATISFYFTNADGQTVKTGSATLPANGQIAAFLDELPFNSLTPFAGSFTLTSSRPVSIVALRGYVNERSDFLLTTTPVTNLDAGSSQDVFPHFADGGGWTTQVVLVNPTDSAISGTLRFTDASGQPISDAGYAIPGRAAWTMTTAGTAAAVSAGSIRIFPSTGSTVPAGSLVFSYRYGGIRVTEAGLPASSAGSAFRLYAELSPTTQSGLAITNSSPIPATLQLELVNTGGSTVASSALTIAANSQIATFLNQAPGFEMISQPFQGLLRVTSSAPVALAGLRGRYNERGDFIITTTPPVPEQSSTVNGDSYFAHFADGGGFTTQFVLFSTVPGVSSGGSLRFVSQTGQPLELKLE